MELRKCKECGKMFEPKGREQYCSDVHYRPCPVCGEPVVAKYLSDPARKCEKCRGKKTAPSGMTVKPMTIPSNKQLFKIPAMTISDPSMKLKEVKKEEKLAKKIEPKQEVVIIDMEDLEPALDKREIAMFCAEMSGSTCRFIRNQALCGWEPGKDYTVTVDHDVAAYVVTATKGDSKIALRCASQTSFFNYFRRVKEA